jgi:predicted TIM-barrel fold metal-dependent hydrolase
VAAVLGLSRGVIVPPRVHGTDSRVTVDALEKSGGRLVGIIRDDMQLSGPELQKLADQGICGVRFSAVQALGDQFDEARFEEFVTRVRPLKWIIDLHLDEASIVRHEEAIGRVRAPVIIDAWARVDPRGREQRPAFGSLRRLLARENIILKLTAANRFVAKGVPYPDLCNMLRELIHIAPGRVIWGSDWPHADVSKPGQMPNDGDLLDMLLDFAPDEKVRRQMLVETPADLFAR